MAGLVTVASAVVAAAGAVAGSWLTSRKSHRREVAELDQIRADIERTRAEAAAAAMGVASKIREAYEPVVDDLRDQVAKAGQEAASCRDAARQAQLRATEAEQQAWRAEVAADQMRRLLIELRPLLQQLPDSAAWLGRIDRLIGHPATI